MTTATPTARYSAIQGARAVAAAAAELHHQLGRDRSDPTADACALAAMVLEAKDSSVGVPDLHERTGWAIRRFNPALAILTAQIDERRVSQAFDGQYVTRWFSLLAEDRLALKDFVKRFQK